MTDTNTTTETTETTQTETTDWQAEAEKWKNLADTTDKRAKRLEDSAKANAAAAKELETLKQSTMGETEKAVSQARAEARAEALREVAGERALDRIRAAAAGRSVDVEALLEGVDASKFLDADGEPDTKAITAWVDRVAPPADESEQPASTRRDLGVGVRGGQQNTALNGDPLLRDLKAKLGIN